MHIFWDCLKFKNYWEGIQRELLSVFNVGLPQTPQFYAIGLLTKGIWGEGGKEAVHYLYKMFIKHPMANCKKDNNNIVVETAPPYISVAELSESIYNLCSRMS